MSLFGVVFVPAATVAGCVDGKTPDCTSIDSGCFPEDASSPVTDAADANTATDANKADGPTPATDASSD